MKNLLIQFILLALAAVLTACGGIGNADPTQTPPAPEILSILATQGSATQVPLPPPGDVSPVVGDSANGAQEPVLPFLAGSPGGTVITDFSTINPGASMTIAGTLNATDDAYVLTDDNGNTVRVNLAPPLIQAYTGQRIEVGGLILQTDAGLVMQAASIVTANESPLPFSTTPTTGTSGSTLFSALQAYDRLVEEQGAALDGLDWVGATGSSITGWVFSFYNPADNSALEYIVSTGAPIESRVIEASDLSSTRPLDRNVITVDSTDVTEAYGITVPELTPLALFADETGRPQWQAIGLNTTLDATGS